MVTGAAVSHMRVVSCKPSRLFTDGHCMSMSTVFLACALGLCESE